MPYSSWAAHGRVGDAAAAGQAALAAPDDGDGAAVGIGADVLAGAADHQVGVSVAVQVAGGEGLAEPVALLGGAGDAGRVLGEDGAAGGADAVRGAVGDDDGARVGLAADRGVGRGGGARSR
ncbi:hypothetical protein GCM10011428_71330 [Streptomyces violaceus]